MIYSLRNLFLSCVLILLIITNNIITYANHALYLSVIEINHEAGKNKARISIKIFTNDLEDALKNAFETEISLDGSQNCITHKKAIEDYFSNHLEIDINNSEISLNFDTCEKNGDSIWLFFQIDCPTEWNEISISADYLMELFPTQSNILNINNGTKKRFSKLTLGNTSAVEKFKE